MIRNIIGIFIIGYLLYLLYPFYQRYIASASDGRSVQGKRFVENIETMASELTYDDAEMLANELRKHLLSRKVPDILNPNQFGINLLKN